MTTRLGAWCEGVAEAGWITAVVAVPLLLNVHSVSTFELDKVALLRSIAFVVVVAAAIGWRERRAEGQSPSWWPPRESRLWLTLALAYLAVLAVATATSIAPRISVWGSLTRVQGLVTTVGYVALHLSLLLLLRRRDQVERLMTSIVLAGIPVALYGIVQHAGADPVPWLGNTSARVTSTLGNPIFAGAFLILVLPLTLLRATSAFGEAARGEGTVLRVSLAAGGILNVVLQIAAWWSGLAVGTLSALLSMGIWSAAGTSLRKPPHAFLRLGAYAIVLAIQLSCLLFTQSRGPWLGLLAALVVLAVGWAAMRRRRTPALVLGGTGVALVVALVAVGLPKASGQAVAGDGEGRYAGRFVGLTEGTGRVRLLVWDAVTRLMTSERSRNVIGYGPETLKFVVAPHLSPGLGHVEQRGALPDRAHNETLDAWVTAGLPGMALYLALMTTLFVLGLSAAGLVGTPAERWLFLLTYAGGGLLAAVASYWLVASWRVAGAIVPLGLSAGLCVFLWGRALAGSVRTGAPVCGTRAEPLILVMLAAVMAHFVETQFGIAVTSTRLYFWTFAAVLVMASRASGVTGAAPEEALAGEPASEPLWRALVAPCLAVGVALVVTMHDFAAVGAPLVAGSILWVMGVTWVLGGVIAVVEAPRSIRDAVRGLALYGGVTLAAAILFAAAWAWRPWVEGADSPLWFHVTILAIILAVGAFFRPPGVVMRRASHGGWLAVVTAAGAAVLVVPASVEPVRANVHYRDGLLSSADSTTDAVAALHRASSLQPRESLYHAALAEVLAIQGLRSTDLAESASLFERAEASLATARVLQPLELEYLAYEARLQVRWGAREPDAAKQQARWERAVGTYSEALALTPSNVVLWNERGAAEFLMGRSDDALATFRHSLRLDEAFAETHLLLANVQQHRGDRAAAARALRAATALVPPERLHVMRTLADELLRFDGGRGAR